MDLQLILSSIQKNLKAPKNQKNSFGNYNYRNAEDILEAVKPLLDGSILTITDEIVLIGDRYYIKATATITAGKDSISAVAFAREPEIQKGMNDSQITGSASSYARKYALNGLFCIDDTKDADSQDNTKPVKKDVKKTGTPATDKQIVYANGLILSTKSDYSKIYEAYGVKKLEELDTYEATDLIDKLKRKKEQIEMTLEELPVEEGSESR